MFEFDDDFDFDAPYELTKRSIPAPPKGVDREVRKAYNAVIKQFAEMERVDRKFDEGVRDKRVQLGIMISKLDKYNVVLKKYNT
jgi:hypothetical protein